MKTCSLVFTLCCAACSQVFGQTLPDYVAALPLPVPGDSWVWAGSPPDDRSRLFAMEGGGSIRILDIAYPAGSLPEFTLRETPFVTLTTSQARSVAFAPDYATSGKLYVVQQTTGGSHIVELRVSSSDPNVADPASVRLIRFFPNLSGDHALGSVHFGRDGMLYIGVGDAFNSANGQLINTVHGKMLRIDVSGADDYPDDANKNFAVPPSNPLIARPLAAPEIWHIGLRNPWRWSFDRWNGDMWICDVGGGRAGEVDRLPGTGTPYSNLGWSYVDGTAPQGGTLNADFTPAQLIAPLLSINREGNQCSTSGGIMYRGNDVRPWRGRFVWSDACSGQIYSAFYDGSALVDLMTNTTQLNNVVTGAPISFTSVSMVAEDGAGELYILQANRGASGSGKIYRVVASGPQPLLADVGQQGGVLGADTLLDNNDFIVFIDLFFANDPQADMGIQGGLRGADQLLDNNDFVVFIDAFFAGD